jgi:hypothetical protein
MVGSDCGNEGFVRVEGGVIGDAAIERVTLCEVPGGMAIPLRFGAVESVLDHCPAEQGGGQGVRAS